MHFSKRKLRFYSLSFLKHDFKASITVFFVALPLCLGISLASGTPVYSGLIAGIIGGIVISLISGSQLSVSGPAAGLTAICAAAIIQLGSLEIFFVAVCLGGILQIILGAFKLGGFTHFIPSAVIKGMLSAIGIILVTKQIPSLIGYDKPDFWAKELFNIITLHNVYSNAEILMHHIHSGVIIITFLLSALLIYWRRNFQHKIDFIPGSFVVVIAGVLLSLAFESFIPSLKLNPNQYVEIPENIFREIQFPAFESILNNAAIWRYGVVISLVASLETLLSIEAIDKLDPYNRITPQNRELVAQGTGNFLSGLLGGIPITAVIVRSSANAEAGGRTKLSSFTHGIWLLLLVIGGAGIVNKIPFCALAIILVQTGYNLAKPSMVKSVYKKGREQFIPFIITVVAILFTDLLIGVLIGIVFSLYFIIKHTYRAGFSIHIKEEEGKKLYYIQLALNVSFLNKGKILEALDAIPSKSIVEIDGRRSVYIDHDVLEIIHDFKPKANIKKISLRLYNIPEVETIELRH